LRFRYSAQEDGTLVKKAVVYTSDEHGIDAAFVDTDAVLIIKRLRQAGYEGYIVGGAVRDLILKLKPKDFDIVSNATPSQIRKLFHNSRIIGQRFRLVHVTLSNKIFEVCTFRSLKEGSTGNVFGTIEEDVLRRDFTINALFYEPIDELIVDYVDGLRDIQEKRIRPIIPLATIFQEDPVRMIRAVKYSVLTDFKLPAQLKQKIQQQAALLATVSASRRTEELFKIIHSSSAGEIVDKLNSLDLYIYLQHSAALLMQERADFRTRYLSTLSNIAAEEPGADLAALVRDYLNDTTDWHNDEDETYKSVFHAARHFILPMSPPRVNLDKAVRLIFKEHGIIIEQACYSDCLRQSTEKPVFNRQRHRPHH
jgi:poly(A) polymerase